MNDTEPQESEYNLRQLTLADWELLKKMRLESLVKEPRVFNGSFEEESQRPDHIWQNRLSEEDKAYFGLFTKEDECIGLTGVLKHKDYNDAVIFLATYIRKEHRGQGLSAFFYKARINWAKKNNFKKAIALYREDNLASIAAGQRIGFVCTSSETKMYPDGTSGLSLRYELDLCL